MYPYLEFLKQRLGEIHAGHSERLKVLAVGLGSGTLQSYLGREGGWDVHTVELDPTVGQIAQNVFGFQPGRHNAIECGWPE